MCYVCGKDCGKGRATTFCSGKFLFKMEGGEVINMKCLIDLMKKVVDSQKVKSIDTKTWSEMQRDIPPQKEQNNTI